ncbi:MULTISPECIES: hypothetical protein [unclassified Caballeronia]|uniref:hypothetical protein n=1 Tax=unclassified Caballeronia TaxID=2646786 RepID=UPI0013ED7975|nr:MULTISPECIES: hypothetical protein [unclassified Caballeronia]
MNEKANVEAEQAESIAKPPCPFSRWRQKPGTPMLPISYHCRYPFKNGESLNRKAKDGGWKYSRRRMAYPLLLILMIFTGGSIA